MSDIDWDWDDESDAERRERRRREIDSEFGDETENWYQKWLDGLAD